MKKEIDKVVKTYKDYENAVETLEIKVREVCDFNARITFCEGDRHLLLNEDTSTVSQLYCLKGKNKNNKLTAEEHENSSL